MREASCSGYVSYIILPKPWVRIAGSSEVPRADHGVTDCETEVKAVTSASLFPVQIFVDDPSVLFLSTHQSGAYPGTGRITEVGTGAGQGATINIPLPGERQYIMSSTTAKTIDDRLKDERQLCLHFALPLSFAIPWMTPMSIRTHCQCDFSSSLAEKPRIRR